MEILKKIIVKVGDSLGRVFAKYHRWKLQFSDNVEINKHAKISSSSSIKIKDGGEIYIGDSEILENVIIQTYGGNIRIGDRCSINANTIIYGHGDTFIGNDVLIAGACMLIPANHVFSKLDSPINAQGLALNPIIIEDDVWIGHGCSILSGVTIGKGSIIAAGSVVNRNIEKYSVVGGVPAKLIKKRN